jgi:hypothetical protein
MLSKLIEEREKALKMNEVVNVNHKPGAIVYEMTQEEHKTSMELAYEAGETKGYADGYADGIGVSGYDPIPPQTNPSKEE